MITPLFPTTIEERQTTTLHLEGDELTLGDLIELVAKARAGKFPNSSRLSLFQGERFRYISVHKALE